MYNVQEHDIKVARGPEKCLNSGIKHNDAGSRQEENKYSTEVNQIWQYIAKGFTGGGPNFLVLI